MSRTTFWTTVPARATRALAMAALAAVVAAGACSSPTAPTPTPEPPPPPPPVAEPPSISCPAPVTASTTSPSGTTVTFTAPTVTNGEAPVTVACTPASDSTFPIGATTVQCTATDARSRTASCSFPVTVTLTIIPQLSKTRFMAFGDSVTSGEVTVPSTGIFPAGGAATGGQHPFYRQALVPSASYPTVLQDLLLARYTAQPGITVVNEGKSGERAADAPARFSAAMSTHRPEVVLLLEGYNGLAQDGGASSGAAAIGIMAAEARNRGARVFIATLTPGKPGFRQIPDDFIRNYNDRMRAIVRGEEAVLVDLYGALLSDVNTWIGVDGLHPTEAGYRKMAETFFASIKADLEVR